MTAGDVLLGMIELLVPGVVILAALGRLVQRGRRVSTPREGGGTQAEQYAVRSALGSGNASGPGAS